MLFADKRALQTNLKLDLLEIREKEVKFYTTNCSNRGFLSSVFSGFASAALMTHVPKQPRLLHFSYLFFTICALWLLLTALVSTTLLAMLAPGLALRGPDGSMNVAIDNLIGEYRTAFLQLLLGLLALHFSVCFFCWLQMPFDWLAVVMTFLVITSLAIELRFVRVTFAKFRLPSEQVVTGKFQGRERASAGADSGVRDLGEIRTLSNLIQEQSTAGAGADDPLRAKERVR